MKAIKFLSLVALFAGLSLTSCKNDSATKEEARQSLATTNTATQVTPNPTNANEPAIPAGPLTTMTFDESAHDFGEIMDGDKIVHLFTFKNTGDEPLIISNAKGSCGCTVPDWPREPIAPGKSGEIRVEYNSKGKGKVGGKKENKRVTITANTDPANTFLNLTGTVNKEEEPTS